MFTSFSISMVSVTGCLMVVKSILISIQIRILLAKRFEVAQLLAAEVFKFITSGLSLQEPLKVINKSDLECFKLALDAKLQGEYSDKYKSMLRFVYDGFTSKLYIMKTSLLTTLNLI